MALQLIYLVFSKLLSWMVLRTRSDTAKEIEILVLRHQLVVLQRRSPRPRMTWPDRALIAVLTRLLPARRRLGLFVTPATILRWQGGRGMVLHDSKDTEEIIERVAALDIGKAEVVACIRVPTRTSRAGGSRRSPPTRR